MKLKEFAKIINNMVEYAEDKDPEVTVIISSKIKEKQYVIDEIVQFGAIPDVTIYIGNKKINSWKKRVISWRL